MTKTKIYRVSKINLNTAVSAGAGAIRNGGLVAFPTETVYGLGADPFNPGAVKRLFKVKGRPRKKPLTAHISGPDMIEEVAIDIPEVGYLLAERFWPGPLTMVMRKGRGIPQEVTAGRDTIGVRMPDHPVALALIEKVGRALVAPSANLSGHPSPTKGKEVIEIFDGKVDVILDAGKTEIGKDSTVVDITTRPMRVYRQGGLPIEDIMQVVNGKLENPDAKGGTD